MPRSETADFPLPGRFCGSTEGEGGLGARGQLEHRSMTTLLDKRDLVGGGIQAIEEVFLIAIRLPFVDVSSPVDHQIMLDCAVVEQGDLNCLARFDSNRVGLEGKITQFYLDR